jgi:hypothetical protein
MKRQAFSLVSVLSLLLVAKKRTHSRDPIFPQRVYGAKTSPQTSPQPVSKGLQSRLLSPAKLLKTYRRYAREGGC